ncbi:MAG: response regulator [Fimbriimonadaceae bacterium]|nr:response regulator [Chitinophagales bacterium]
MFFPGSFIHTLLFQLPYRDTWFFDLVIILLVVAILYLLIRRRISQSADMQKLLRDKVRDKTKALEEQKERAEHSEKAKEQFLANMSHEIRTPMNAIVQATRLLLENEPKENQLKYLNAIKHSSDNLLVIINDILDLSKIEAGRINFEHIDFNLQEQIQSAYDTLKINSDEKKLELTYDISKDVPLLLNGDPYRLIQIILNLAGNAIKFTEKGSVKISIETAEKQNDFVHLKFSVTDTGIGIANDKLDYIFDMFTQETTSTTRKFGGTGLGLAICKRLIEMQGGSIHVNSKVGHGSTFHFILNYKISNASEKHDQDQRKASNKKIPVEGLRIILAEDNEFNQMVAVDTIEASIKNVIVDVAKTGKQVIEFVLKNNYDLILMDIQMPEMDGHEATKIIRNMSDPNINSIPIIAMTASVIKAEVDKCFESGMNEFVGKPFKVEELMDKISKVMQQNN